MKKNELQKKEYEQNRNGKRMFRRVTQGISLFLCLGLLAGCGATRDTSERAMMNSGGATATKSALGYNADAVYAEDALWNDGVNYEMADSEGGTSASTNSNLEQSSASKRKLIKNVSMNVETQEYEQLMANVENRIKELGGYVEHMESYNGSGYNTSYGYSNPRRNASLVIRIPQARLDKFVNSVSELGNVINRSESVNDVTLQYVDVESHKEALQVEQARLLELLERAEYLEDIITLENRLTSIRYQIESMESSLRTFDDQVDYSTVNLRIQEVAVYTVVEEVKQSVWERMAEGFMGSLKAVANGFVEFGVWFVVKLPYLVVWAVVITIIVLVIKKIRGGKKGKTEKKRKGKKNVAVEEQTEGKEQEAFLTKAENEKPEGKE